MFLQTEHQLLKHYFNLYVYGAKFNSGFIGQLLINILCQLSFLMAFMLSLHLHLNTQSSLTAVGKTGIF